MTSRAPHPEARPLASALNVLYQKSLEGLTYTLHNRIAWKDDAIWIDLVDESWQGICITTNDWAIKKQPILFRRYAQQLQLTTPTRAGSPWKLLEFVNVRDDDKLLFMVYALALLIPNIPHPILVVFGQQGSAKSTLTSLTKDLIDPSAVGITALPRNERELIQMLDHQYLSYFDNVGSLPDWLSDALCCATTGGGFSKRALYTDDDGIIYSILRSIGINSINVAARKPDFLDRSLLIGLEPISDDERKTLQSIRISFEKEKPGILGGMLDTIVRALRMPEPKLDKVFRMADFVSWGYRIAEALGTGLGERFLSDYTRNVQNQAEESVRADIVSEVLLDLLLGYVDRKYEGTATQLLIALRQKAEDLHISTRQHEWPKSSNALSRRLRLLKDPLTRIGYSVEFNRDADGTRKLVIADISTKNTDKLSRDSNSRDAHLRIHAGKLLKKNDGSSDRQKTLDDIRILVRRRY